MAILFKKEKGKNIYKGIVGKEQIQKADKVHEYLVARIPRLETELSEQYEKISIQFWYYFGKGLREIVEKFDIDNQDRQYLWEAIANLAASDVSVRKNRSSNSARCAHLASSFGDIVAKRKQEIIKKM